MEASNIRSSEAELLSFSGGEGAIAMPTDIISRSGDASVPIPAPPPAPLPPMQALEEAAQQVLDCFHPTLESEEERRGIVDYVQRLIKSNLNSEVFPYGSVPLKTYLPDGDIDLTIINFTNTAESLADDVRALLQREEMNVDAEFKIKEVKLIDAAEVKLVKCIVHNTVIDMSFNQLGGLSTLCFLEQVDRLVGKNHLFKRSIILIKAWCYYESRILGAHHGLISTYALGTLVLYIFLLYHSSLCGPLEVLYRFLEYYSEFNWENYCISLKGPVFKSYLPDIVVMVPEEGWTDLMFSEDILDHCMETFSVSRELEGNPKAFQPKFLDIIDPLKKNNNLGRSVNIGNSYRIRSAFKYGARKLGEVLLLPLEEVSEELCKFFSNAIASPGKDNRSSIQHEEPEAFTPFADLSGDYDRHIRSLLYGKLCHGFPLPAVVHPHPSMPAWTQPWDLVHQSMPSMWSRLSQLTLPPVATEQSNCRAAYSARGTGSCMPQVNRHGQSNGSPVKNKEKGRSQHQRRSNAKSLSPHSVPHGASSGLRRIEFGSVGDLAERLRAASAVIEGPTQNETELIHLQNDAEFPPLC